MRAIHLSGATCALLVAACAGDRRVDGEESQSCESANWRQPSEGEVICPGAPGCACGGSEVCCVATTAEYEITGASCTPLELCRDFAFTCDGPEDCGADEVCCSQLASGGGSDCRAAIDCFGSAHRVMCRSDEDCGGFETCTPAERGSYYDGKAAVCEL